MKHRLSYVVITSLLALLPLFASAQAKLEGTVTSTKLTACGIVAGKQGKCEGNLVLESNGKQTTVNVTRDTLLKKGDEQLFLFQLKGAPVVVTMGPNNVAQLVQVKK